MGKKLTRADRLEKRAKEHAHAMHDAVQMAKRGGVEASDETRMVAYLSFKDGAAFILRQLAAMLEEDNPLRRLAAELKRKGGPDGG